MTSESLATLDGATAAVGAGGTQPPGAETWTAGPHHRGTVGKAAAGVGVGVDVDVNWTPDGAWYQWLRERRRKEKREKAGNNI